MRIERFTPPNAPNILSYKNLQKSILESGLQESSWLYKKKGSDIKTSELNKLVDWIVEDETNYLIIRNCTLIDFDTISGINPSQNKNVDLVGLIFIQCVLPGLKIENCQFTEICWIGSYLTDECIIEKNCNIGYIRAQDKTITDSIEIDASKVSYVHIYNECNIHSITARNNSELKSIDIYRSSYCSFVFVPGCYLDSINITHGSEVRNIDVAYEAEVEIIHIEDSKIGTFTCWFHSSIDRMRLDHNTKIEQVNFINDAACKELLIRDNSEAENINIEKKCTVFNIDISDSSLKNVQMQESFGSFFLRNAVIDSLRISNCHLPYFEWTAHTVSQVFIQNCTINNYLLHHSIVKSGSTIACSQTKIFSIVIDEVLVLGVLLFRDLTNLPNPLFWNMENKFHSEKKIIYDKQKVFQEHISWKPLSVRGSDQLALFRISNSSLGKSEITGSRINEFYFEYRNSKILDMFISGTNFPKENIHIVQETFDNKYNFQQLVSIYDQLKRLSEAQGNLVDASWYHSRAMHFQERLAHLVERRWPHMAVHKGLANWMEAKAYRLNAISNSHGESWPKALLFIFLTSAVVYTIYYRILNHDLPFSWNDADDFIAHYFSFLDPTHKADFLVEKNKLNAWSSFIDFLGRIIIGYGIYQFIAAFRRHGRKGS